MSILGSKCVGCGSRFWKGGGVVRTVGKCGETGVDIEYDFPICEACSVDMDRVSEVGAAIRDEMGKPE